MLFLTKTQKHEWGSDFINANLFQSLLPWNILVFDKNSDKKGVAACFVPSLSYRTHVEHRKK